MAWRVEVSPYFTVRSVVTGVVEVGLEPVHQTFFGLPNVLYATTFACKAIQHIGTLASDVVFRYILSTRC